ncbi:MAG: SUMF1/EgtB/PvdO family nonheme iron enzyme [Proteobacteria bacterium]|nr:SUMF1/EgtB/PvdO family nonheme iron enzyme [Pseudomonadota bacterium]MDA0928500.1 SUMF1/EgtB/PvdO family nonheme iron enzyme [Pseudomonadota bacterium]
MNDKAATETRKVPGRTLGFSVMTVLSLLVGFFLFQQGSQPQDIASAESVVSTPSLPGFRSDMWFLPADDMLGFVEIPAGPFTMGSNPALDRMAYENERWSNTRRQGEVTLPTYYIARYETTIAQYAAYAKDTGIASPETPLDSPGALPLTGITWPEAIAYTRWLDNKLRTSEDTPLPLRQFLDNGGKVQLPSEAEWEKAARGTDGRVFPWRDAAPAELANFNGSEPREVTAVNCSECAFGLSDMAGNVWEFTRSPLQDYPYSEEDDGEGLSEDALYVMRGGSFADPLNNIRTAIRGGIDPGVRNPAIGFRVVISTY